ncbi:TetR/AcrR family transcriptional regulator [Streptomyces roseicoloratus]|uniref:TetR/AcrR family transcriptional regulator n=1 Tax=Streptomyces roseicoloratus TaxID=2508722 RepID=A0ABY9RYY5_9ACTN|nr:TetR/AcrR family transcriptional regulator [Streptomyces roseicoloratus]WMX46928.1 TetR/AcrR family transcriptional regulator [Streptomyces roseicoloratus]
MSEEPKPRRRQARGERRIAQLLQAAAKVFCANGYTATSTNAIAREASVSPGTLYQYFPNKEAIAIELGDRLLTQMREYHGQAFTPENFALPLPRLLDAVLDPLIAFNVENPVFFALMHGSEIPGRIAEEHDALHASLLARVGKLLGHYLPDGDPAQHSRTADMTFAIVKSGLALILAAPEGAERDAVIRETKTALLRYLDPVIGEVLTGAPTPAPAPAPAPAPTPTPAP